MLHCITRTLPGTCIAVRLTEFVYTEDKLHIIHLSQWGSLESATIKAAQDAPETVPLDMCFNHSQINNMGKK